MRTIRTVKAMTAWSAAHHREGVTIGLVPTMGALHAGHRALIRAARLSSDAVVVSLFVIAMRLSSALLFSFHFLQHTKRNKTKQLHYH